jgi:hypothetical protein
MFQVDDTFLEELGIKDIPEAQREKMRAQLTEELEDRIGEKVMANLSEEQITEFEGLFTQDDSHQHRWLQKNMPEYKQAADYKEFIKEAGVTEDQIVPADVLADFVTVKWFETNSPDYQNLVKEAMEELKEELIHSRDTIMESV